MKYELQIKKLEKAFDQIDGVYRVSFDNDMFTISFDYEENEENESEFQENVKKICGVYPTPCISVLNDWFVYFDGIVKKIQ